MPDVALRRAVPVPMGDGTLLATDVWLPSTISAPPVLLRTPYGRGLAPLARPLDVLGLLDAGIPVVLQDVRGRGASGGTFVPFVQEPADTVDTVRWVREQSWCLGPPAMTGPSYLGHLQLQVADTPDLLGAISPQLAPRDIGRDWAYRQGLFQHGSASWWCLQALALPEALRAGDTEAAAAVSGVLDGLRSGSYPDPGALPPPADRLAPAYREWVDHPEGSSYWRAPERTPPLQDPQVPALLTGGWFDPFLRGTLGTYRELRAAGEDPQLVVGPWSHTSLTGDFPGRGYGVRAHADRFGLTAAHCAFFRAAARGEPPPGPAVRAFVLGPDRWVTEDSWPGEGAEEVRIELGACEVVRTSSPERGSLSSPGGPTLMSGAYGLDRVGPVPLDGAAAHEHAVVLRLPRSTARLPLAGPARVSLRWRSAAHQVHVALGAVEPDGVCRLLTDGAARVRDDQVEVDLADVCSWHPAGELRLVVRASDEPRFHRGPAPATAPDVDLRRSFLTLHVRPSGVLPQTLD